jgi:hypothetical protein
VAFNNQQAFMLFTFNEVQLDSDEACEHMRLKRKQEMFKFK